MRPKWFIRLRKNFFYYGMAVIVGISLFISCLRMNTEHIFLCVLTLILFMLPHVLNRWLKLYIPPVMEIVIVAFIVCGIVLGEVENFFVRFPYWDTIMHTVNGIVCAALSLSLVVLLNKQDKILFRLSPVFLMVVAVSFSMLIGVLWEFFEFGVDRIMKKDMQKDTWVSEISTVSLNTGFYSRVTTISPIEKVTINDGEAVLNGYLDIGLYDTMEDLFVTFVGAVSFNLFAAIYSKKHKGFIFCLLIDTQEHTKKRMEEQYHEKKSYHD